MGLFNEFLFKKNNVFPVSTRQKDYKHSCSIHQKRLPTPSKKKLPKAIDKKKIKKSSKTHHNSHLSLHGPSPWKQPRRPRRRRAAKWPCPALQKRPPRQPTWACQPGSQLCWALGSSSIKPSGNLTVCY